MRKFLKELHVLHPIFTPFYLILVIYLVYWSFQLAKQEYKGGEHSLSQANFNYTGIVFIAFGFSAVQYIEWSKKFQYKPYTREEVGQHKTLETGVWLIVENDVYDVTDFVKNHPPGSSKILQKGGMDATKDFAYHLDSTKHFWRRAKIGWIVDKHDSV